MDFLHIIDQLNYLIGHSAGQWWIIPLVSVFCLIDGFFLFLPSETAIVALASIAARTGEPNIWLLILGTSLGAIAGDNIAYFMGRKLGVSRFKWMRRPRGAKAFAWAGKELEKRGAILIFTARYIPVGRIAVNFTAGATYFPWRRFVIIDSIAVVTWAGYSVAVGTFAGHWIHHNPLLGVVVAIAFAIVVGFIVDHAMKYLHRFLEKRGKLAPRPEPGLKAAELAARVQAAAAAGVAAAEAAKLEAAGQPDGAGTTETTGPAAVDGQPESTGFPRAARTKDTGGPTSAGGQEHAPATPGDAPMANVTGTPQAPGELPDVGIFTEIPAGLAENRHAAPVPDPLNEALAHGHSGHKQLAQHEPLP